MRATLLHLGQAWLVCAVVGVAALTPLRRAWRSLWLPAAPVVGAAFLVVALHATTLLVPVRIGVYVALGLALAPVVVGWRRGERPWHVDRRAWPAVAASSLIGLVGAVLALLPNLRLGTPRVLMSSWNNDAFFYVSESVWFTGHTLRESPPLSERLGPDTVSPVTAAAQQAMTIPLRVGQSLLSAGIQQLWGVDDVEAFMALMAAWVLIGAGGVLVAARLVGFGPLAGLLAAALVTTNALVTRTAYDQHADSLLGIALLLPTICAFLAAVLRRHPIWPAALLLAGVLGSYTEYVAFVVPACAAGVLVSGHAAWAGRWREGTVAWRRRITRAAGIVALSILLAPLAWLRGLRNLLVSQSGGDTFPSPFLSDSRLLSLARAAGLTEVQATAVPTVAVLLVVGTVLVGLLAAVVLSRFRWGLIGGVGAGLGLTAMATLTSRGYLQDRLVTLVVPLVLWVCVGGWALLVGELRRPPPLRRRRLVATSVAAVGLLVAGVGLVGNVRTTVAHADRWAGTPRLVGGEYAVLASWARELGGPDGQDITVVVPDLFQQMWVLYELRGLPAVSYTSLHHDYLVHDRYWSGELDRYLLVGPGVPTSAAPGVIVRSVGGFRLLDLQRGAAVVLAPTAMDSWGEFVDGAGTLAAGPQSRMVVLRSPGSPDRLSLRISSAAPGAVLTVTGPAGPTSVDPTTGTATLSLGSAPITEIALSSSDPRDLQRLLRVSDPRLGP